MLHTTIFLISEVVQIYAVYLLIRCFFKECRVSAIGEFGIYVGLYLAMTVPYLILGIPMLTLFFSVTGILGTTLAYQATWKKRIVAGVLVYGVIALAEMVVALLFGYIRLDLFEKAEYFSIFGTICLPLVRLLIVLIIRNFVHIREGEEISGIYWAVSVMLPMLSIYLQLVFYSQSEISAWQMISCAVVLFLINLFVFYLFDRQSEGMRIKHEKENLELQNQYQLKQMDVMNQSVEISRMQKHDFLKHISMISYLAKEGKQERLFDYLQKMHDVIEKHEHYVDTGNLMLDAIINIKMQELTLCGVEVQTRIAVPDNLELSAYELNIILSNLLDNCKEAVERIADKKVLLNIECVKERFYIEVENAYESLSFSECGELLTTKNDKEEHGYGIRNIREAVERCGGTMTMKEENGRFKVRICIFL